MDKSQKITKTYMSITKGAIHTLLILFVLGMIANLYVEIPAGGDAWAWIFKNSAVIAVHAVLGTVLLIVAIASLILAILDKQGSRIVASAFGLFFTGAAAYFGSVFVTADSELSSLLMALGFLGALVSYALAVFQQKKVK
jgi:hypothetical protein